MNDYRSLYANAEFCTAAAAAQAKKDQKEPFHAKIIPPAIVLSSLQEDSWLLTSGTVAIILCIAFLKLHFHFFLGKEMIY